MPTALLRSPFLFAACMSAAFSVGLPSVVAAAPRPFVKVPASAVRVAEGSGRYIVFARSVGVGTHVVRLLDSKTGRVRSQSLPEGCWLAADVLSVANGRLLVICGTGSAIMNLASGRLEAQGLRPVMPDGTPYADLVWSQMGTAWLALGTEYRNVRTGEIRRMSAPDTPSELRNLDDPELSPLAFCQPFASEYRILSMQQSSGRVAFVDHSSGHLKVGRCGHRASSKDVSGGPATSDNSVAYGHTAWSAVRKGPGHCGTDVGVFSFGRNRTTWFPRSARRNCVDIVRHTKYGVVIGSYIGVDPDDTDSPPENLYQLWLAPLPK